MAHAEQSFSYWTFERTSRISRFSNSNVGRDRPLSPCVQIKKLQEKVFKARSVVERLKDVVDSLKNYYPPEELRLMLLFRGAGPITV